ncbi:hypothetical protein [Methylobacterium dankookense]|uniref:Uncharacterized protein n=1 Tax=Methylobacterium dankookense TaxID=560405 RepID=A0A564FSY6_9HYPH|nr:hypothetical protein [Methylobacterium dankookense]GJD57191.1 hypothetical protein IFDJLNFL_3091 [Methylobacterium dankookense]VUF10810.1 hypothetical protein MTDSW087_00482 [Methylobacterium dankookense]
MTLSRTDIGRPSIFIVVATGLLIGLPATGLAAELPLQGEYRITYTGVNPAPMKPVMIGPQRTVATSLSIMTAVNAGGSGLLHNMTGRCNGMATIDNQAKTLENHGFCDYVDADGDHVFEKWDYPVQPLAATGQGTGEWIGGTGKFTGISGQLTIKSQRVNALTEGIVQFVGEKTGSYTISRKTAGGD